MKKIIFKVIGWCCLSCVILILSTVFLIENSEIENELLQGIIIYGILGIIISISVGLFLSVDEPLVKMSNFDWSLDSVKSLNYLRGSLSYVYYFLFLVVGYSIFGLLYNSDLRNLNFIFFILSVLLYTGLVIYSYFRVTFGKEDSIFLLRVLLFIALFYTLGIVSDNILYYITSDDKITSYDDLLVMFFWFGLPIIAIISANIKGLMVTYSNEAKIAFPKSERRISFIDIFISLLVASFLIFYRFLSTHIIDVNLLFTGENRTF